MCVVCDNFRKKNLIVLHKVTDNVFSVPSKNPKNFQARQTIYLGLTCHIYLLICILL